MKKITAIVIGAVMTLSVTAYSNNAPEKDNPQKQATGKVINTSGENVQIPNLFVNCKTMEDAEKIAGFTVTISSKMPEGYAQKSIEAIENGMVQVFYGNGEKEILIRKAKGNEDISGDYNNYKENNTITVGSLKVSTKRNDGKAKVVTWIDGAYTYSITANSSETGFDKDAISDMVPGIR